MFWPLVTKTNSIITYQDVHSNIPRANELTENMKSLNWDLSDKFQEEYYLKVWSMYISCTVCQNVNTVCSDCKVFCYLLTLWCVAKIHFIKHLYPDPCGRRQHNVITECYTGFCSLKNVIYLSKLIFKCQPFLFFTLNLSSLRLQMHFFSLCWLERVAMACFKTFSLIGWFSKCWSI